MNTKQTYKNTKIILINTFHGKYIQTRTDDTGKAAQSDVDSILSCSDSKCYCHKIKDIILQAVTEDERVITKMVIK